MNTSKRHFLTCLLLFAMFSAEWLVLQPFTSEDHSMPSRLSDVIHDSNIKQNHAAATEANFYYWYDYLKAYDAFNIFKITAAEQWPITRARTSFTVINKFLLLGCLGLFFYRRLPYVLDLENGAHCITTGIQKKDGKK